MTSHNVSSPIAPCSLLGRQASAGRCHFRKKEIHLRPSILYAEPFPGLHQLVDNGRTAKHMEDVECWSRKNNTSASSEDTEIQGSVHVPRLCCIYRVPASILLQSLLWWSDWEGIQDSASSISHLRTIKFYSSTWTTECPLLDGVE